MQTNGIDLLRATFITIFFFTYFFLNAQRDFNFSGHSIEIGGIYTLKNKISPIPDGIDGITLGTRGQIGFEANLSQTITVKNNWAVNLVYIFGVYPFDIKYDIKKEFIGSAEKFSNLSNSISYIKYTGAEIGLAKLFKIKNNLFSINGDCSFIYFVGDWNLQERYDGEILPDNLVYKRLFIPNQNGNIIVAPSLKIKLYKKMKNRLWLYTFLTGTLSSEIILDGSYKVIGENETLKGTFDKKYAHVGFGIGFHVMKKEI